MERCSGWAEACSIDAHLVERLGIHDVEAAASIHQDFGELLRANDWINHERVPPWLRDALRVVGPIEGYSGLSPLEEGRCGRFGSIDLAMRDLLAALGVVGF